MNSSRFLICSPAESSGDGDSSFGRLSPSGRHTLSTRRTPSVRRLVSAIAIALLAAISWPAFAAAADLMIRTLNAETGKPVSDVTVRLVEPSRLEFSDHRGHVAFRGLPPGRYQVYANHVSYLPADTMEVVLTDGAGGSAESARPFELRLEPTAWVVDQVVITGTRSPHLLKNVPVQTELVTKKDFVRTGATTVDEALAWAGSTKRRVAFHNGVMGQFENRAFAAGTESLVETLKALHAAGVAVYVGGGEGRAALERYGSLGDVTHAFTAGGTILKCLADEPLPFLEALAAQASGQD